MRDILEYIDDAILHLLLRDTEDEGLENFTAGKVHDLFWENVNDNLSGESIDESLERIRSNGYVHSIDDDWADKYFILSDKFHEKYSARAELKSSPLQKIEHLGLGWCCSAIDNYWESPQHISDPVLREADVISETEADTWEPLPIDRDAPDYHAAVEAIEEAAEAIRRDNGFAATEPEKRDSVVEALNTGLDWIKSKSPTLEQVNSTVRAALRYASKKFGDSGVGQITKKAIEALDTWIGSLF